MEPERALLVDSDTFSKWLFQPFEECDAVIRYQDVPTEIVLYVGFPTVADLYFNVRRRRDRLALEQGPEVAARFYDEGVAALNQWFTEWVFVLHSGDERMSKRWLDIVNEDPVHENANREHAWMVALAEYLRDNRRLVGIASEDPDLYQAFADRGHLEGVGILRPN